MDATEDGARARTTGSARMAQRGFHGASTATPTRLAGAGEAIEPVLATITVLTTRIMLAAVHILILAAMALPRRWAGTRVGTTLLVGTRPTVETGLGGALVQHIDLTVLP